MKHIASILLAAAFAITATAADNKAVESAKQVSSLYKAKEWSFESAYTLRTEDFDRYKESVTIGGNYHWTKNAGFHAAVALNDLEHQGIDLVEFGPTARLTFGNSPVAVLFGVGAEHRFVNDSKGSPGGWDKEKSKKTPATDDIEDSWACYAEIGLTYRTKYFDPFVKIRGVRPIESSKGEHVGLFAGVSIPLPF